MIVDSEDESPLYQQLANLMREKIYSREWLPRTRIPSEHELMETYGIARGTARKAIKTLVGEGLVVQERGRGSFVAGTGPSYPAGVRPLSFADSLSDQGLAFVTRVLYEAVTPTPAHVALDLGLSANEPSLFVRRVRSVAGEPIMCQESWSPLRACPGLEDADLTRESMFDAVERCSGRKINYSVIRYSARAAGKELGRYLACEDSTPILVLEQLIRLADDTPIESSHTYLKPGQSVIGMAVQPELR